MTAQEFDAYVDDGGDVSELFETGEVERPNAGRRRVNVDMDARLIDRLDERARKYDVPRQALIKMWLGERLNEEDEREARLRAS
jgi:hypothetical protein